MLSWAVGLKLSAANKKKKRQAPCYAFKIAIFGASESAPYITLLGPFAATENILRYRRSKDAEVI